MIKTGRPAYQEAPEGGPPRARAEAFGEERVEAGGALLALAHRAQDPAALEGREHHLGWRAALHRIEILGIALDQGRGQTLRPGHRVLPQDLGADFTPGAPREPGQHRFGISFPDTLDQRPIAPPCVLYNRHFVRVAFNEYCS